MATAAYGWPEASVTLDTKKKEDKIPDKTKADNQTTKAEVNKFAGTMKIVKGTHVLSSTCPQRIFPI